MALGATLLASGSLRALDRDQSLQQLGHRVWSAKDGLFGNVYALAQTKDGFLWVGGSDGLYRFDGYRFEHYVPDAEELPSLRVNTLFAGSDGSLWIGYTNGRMAHIARNVAKVFGENDGVPVGRNNFIVEDAEGKVWAAGTGGLVRFDGSRFQRVRNDWSYPEKTADTAEIDSSGTLWTSLEGRTYYLLRGDHAFHQIAGTTDRVTTIVPHGSKVALYTTGNPNRVYLRDCPRYQPIPQPYISHDRNLLEDRDHSVWITAQLGGLQRTSSLEKLAEASAQDKDPADLQAFSRRDGLSGGAPLTALEDQEGSIWIATEQGLDQFTRRNIVARASFPDEWGANVVEGPDGKVWYTPLVSNNQENRTWTRVLDRKKLDKPYPDILAIHRATDGSVWFFSSSETHSSLSHWTQRGITQLPLPSKPNSATRVRSITTDLQGNPWVSISDNGIWRHDGESWLRVPTENHDRDSTANFAATDNDGTTWFLSPGRLVSSTGDALHIVKDNLPSPPFIGMAWSGKELFVAGQDGISAGGTQGFRHISLPLETSHIFALVASDRSGLWFAFPKGICHISRASIEASRIRPLSEKDLEVFGIMNDLPDVPDQSIGRGIESSDGRVWLTSTTSALEVDPERVLRNTRAPNVVLESVMTDAGPLTLQNAMRIQPHYGTIRISFAALSLRLPEHNRFSYRLRPGSEEWSTPGTSHEAVFGNLSPGRYVFEVRGSNNDGVWSYAPATFTFSVLPAFYQTWWFRALYILLAAGLLYLAYLWRMRRIVARVRLQSEARFAERERIARDLHDSLLSEVQGLTLRVGTIVDLTPNSDALKEGMERTLKVAQEVMKSGRERVQKLREASVTGEAFVSQIKSACLRYESDYTGALRFETSGTVPAKLDSVIATELYQIITEAAFNAFRHANSPAIEVTLRFDEDKLIATVKDQGKGFDDKLWKEKSSSHFGLSGMHERAREAGAELLVNSSQDGTTISIRIRSKGLYISPGTR